MIKENKNKNKSIFLDKLNLIAVIKLLFNTDVKTVRVLDPITKAQRIYKILFLLRSIEIYVENFFVGDLFSDENESLYLKARKEAGLLSIEMSKDMIKSNKILCQMNLKYGRNTIILSLAKQIQMQVEYYFIRALISQKLSEDKENVQLWIKTPLLFNGSMLNKKINFINFTFYFNGLNNSLALSKTLFIYFWKNIIIKIQYLFYKPGIEENKYYGKSSVLTIDEDSISDDRSIRRHPHWIEDTNNYPTYVLEPYSFKKKSKINNKGFKNLKNETIILLNWKIISKSDRLSKNYLVFKDIQSDRRSILINLFLLLSLVKISISLRVLELLREAERMGSICLFLNTKIFILKDVQALQMDALQIVADKTGVRTIALQYSNLGIVSPLMLTTADYFFAFSRYYEKVFETDLIKPQRFIYSGYLYSGFEKYFYERVKNKRSRLENEGVNFVIAYFDESVQNNKWGIISNEYHYNEIHQLCDYILRHSDVAVVIKSQFITNSPSKLYPDDIIIENAKKTGRFIELNMGNHRNNIYPAEAGLLADFCINHKFGATAGLEAAILGKRTILLDTHGYKTYFDDFYCSADIIYKDLTICLNAIDEFRRGNINYKKIGDWSNIISIFHSNNSSICEINNLINQYIY